jgi:hypothetical protein
LTPRAGVSVAFCGAAEPQGILVFRRSPPMNGLSVAFSAPITDRLLIDGEANL